MTFLLNGIRLALGVTQRRDDGAIFVLCDCATRSHFQKERQHMNEHTKPKNGTPESVQIRGHL